MPRKLYPSEPAVFFEQLLKETHAEDPEFAVKTTDPAYESFVNDLINEHFPPQSQLPLDYIV